MVKKAADGDADMVILDLEDAVAPSQKVAARAIVVEALESLDWGERIVAVRVNDWLSRWTVGDLVALVAGAARLDVVVLPKVEDPAMVRALDLVLGQLEMDACIPPGSIGIDAQIETARGVQELGAICAASRRVEALVLGPLDLAASLGMPAQVAHGRRRLDPVASTMVVAARSAGLQVLDGPYVQIRDVDGLRTDARWALEIGFDGKWALHPDQVEPLHEVFSPSPDELARAVRILEVYEAATSGEGRGAVLVDGEMVDEASCRIARTVVARARRGGVSGRGPRS